MKYMVSITFVPEHETEIAALIPQERAHIGELRTKGIIDMLYISQENGGLAWIVMNGESKEEVQKELEALPLYQYMVPPEIKTLT